jgi:hypothetical protein
VGETIQPDVVFSVEGVDFLPWSGRGHGGIVRLFSRKSDGTQTESGTNGSEGDALDNLPWPATIFSALTLPFAIEVRRMNFAAAFEQGLSYDAFLAKFGTDEHKRRWKAVYDQVVLSEQQVALLRSFKREMKVLVVAGTWCGDCVNQCPIFAHFTAANEKIRIQFFDRDASADLAKELSMCGAPRVPSLLFLSEDNFPCGRGGDRTLSTYRDMAARQLGPTCPTGIAPPDKSVLQNVVQDWLNEFERIQLMLRTSGRLRQMHGD